MSNHLCGSSQEPQGSYVVMVELSFHSKFKCSFSLKFKIANNNNHNNVIFKVVHLRKMLMRDFVSNISTYRTVINDDAVCVCVCGQQPRVACLQYERSVSFSFKSQITERKVCALQPWPTGPQPLSSSH